MKLSISNIAWTAAHDIEMYGFLSANGFSGIEIAPTRIFAEQPYEHLAAATSFAGQLLSEYDLGIASMQSISFGRTEAIFGSESERQSMLDYLKKAIDFAAAATCPNLVFGSPKNRIIGDGQQDVAIDFFRSCGIYAASKGTVFALEPNPVIYGTNFINTTAEAFDFVRNIGQEGLRVNFDFGTFIENNENLNLVRDNFDYIHHIHISEPYLEPLQKRREHQELAALLKEKEYSRYVSIEMKNTDDIAVVKEAMLYIKEIFDAA